MKRIFIIILNWNGIKDTLDCLRSLEKLDVKNIDLFVIVIDNGSTNDSILLLKKYKARTFRFKLLKNKGNLGFAEGNNRGMDYALANNSDFILLLNNDTIVDRNILVELTKAAEKYKDTMVFTPKIYFAKGYEFHKKYSDDLLGKVIWSAGGEIDWNNVYAKNIGVDEVDTGQFGRDRECDFATGACMFIRSDAIRSCGNFDARYFMYFEDVDLCERYRRKGGKVMYISKAFLWHKVAQSSGIGSDLNDYFITRNRLLFGMGYAKMRTKIALYRESVKLLMYGRSWQKKGVIDFYMANFKKGSWK